MIENEDIILLNSLKSGDERALKMLFFKFWDKIYALAYDKLGDEQDADRLVQELFISIWKRRTTLKLKGSFEQFLIDELKSKAINTAKKAK